MSTVCQLCVNCVSTVCQLCVNCVSTVCQLCVNCVSTVCQLCVNCVSTVCQLCVNCVSTVSTVSTGQLVNWSTGQLCQLLYVYVCRGQQLVLYGEMSKSVVMSPQRISNIIVSSNDVEVELTGASWEKVVFSLSYGGQLLQMPCLLSSAGRARISVLEGTCVPV